MHILIVILIHSYWVREEITTSQLKQNMISEQVAVPSRKGNVVPRDLKLSSKCARCSNIKVYIMGMLKK